MKLITIAILLPFLNFLTFFIKKENGEIDEKFSYFISKFFAIFYVAILFGIYQDLDNNFLQFFSYNSQIKFAISASKNNIKQLFLLSFLWLFLIFYGKKFSDFYKYKSKDFVVFLTITIAFLNILILSKNIITALFSYNILTLLFLFIFDKFLIIKKDKKFNFFVFFIIFEMLILLVSSLLIFSFSQNFDFLKNAAFLNATKNQTFLLFLMILSSFLSSIFSCQFLFFHKNYNFDFLKIYLSLILIFAFSKIIFLTKIIEQILGIGLFSMSFGSLKFSIIQSFFILPFFISLFYVLFCQDFRKILFYIFYNQITTTFLATLILLYVDDFNSYNAINFSLATTLTFITFSNFTIYLKNAENKAIDGIFYNFKITISLLIFAFANLILENIILAKKALNNELFIAFIIFISAAIGLFLFIYKLILPSFAKENITILQNDENLAKKIDFSSHLSLTAVLIAVIIIALKFL